jgi:hypothetical protein
MSHQNEPPAGTGVDSSNVTSDMEQPAPPRRQVGLRESEKESPCCFEHGRLEDKQGVLHCMEAADEKLAWRVVSGHCQ